MLRLLVMLALSIPLASATIFGDAEGGRRQFREQAARVDKTLEVLEQPLPDASTKALRKAIEDSDSAAIEAALEESIFMIVTINPEGRVKLARGPAVPLLIQKQARYALVKVVNQSGGRQCLAAHGTYTGAADNPFALTFSAVKAMPPELTGLEVEYRLLSITCSAAGRHELSVGVDAGQGTQDLSFRGEAPVLFTVIEPAKP